MAVLAYLPRFMARPIVAEFQRLAPEIRVWTSIDDAPPEEVEVVIAWSMPEAAGVPSRCRREPATTA